MLAIIDGDDQVAVTLVNALDDRWLQNVKSLAVDAGGTVDSNDASTAPDFMELMQRTFSELRRLGDNSVSAVHLAMALINESSTEIVSLRGDVKRELLVAEFEKVATRYRNL